jgi:exopolysaccharide production protein ExoQ
MAERAPPRSLVRRVSRQRVIARVRAARATPWRTGRSRAAKERGAPPRIRGSGTSREFDSDGFFAFALFVPMLFISGLGTLGAALFSGLAVVYAVARLRQLGEIFAPRAFLLIIPAFAVFSILWSESPSDTLKYSLEFSLTVGFALLMSAAPRPKAVLWGMFLAFALYIVAALAFGQVVDLGNNGETAFSGLTESKNLLADIGSTGLLVSLACFVAGFEDRRPFRSILALVVAAAQIYALIEARSAGALLGIAPAMLCFIFLLALRPARLMIRLMLTMLAALSTAILALGYGSNLVEDGMTLFDKDPTLTGRTYLWQRAADLIAEKPILGKGFNAFWLQGNPDAEGLWRYAGIVERSGFSFHNTMIEVLVNLGWLGVVVFSIVAVAGIALLLRRVMTRPTLALCFWLSVLVYEFVRMPIEAIGTAPFYFSTVLLFAAFGSALAPRRLGAMAKVARRQSYRLRAPRPAFQRGSLRERRFSA